MELPENDKHGNKAFIGAVGLIVIVIILLVKGILETT